MRIDAGAFRDLHAHGARNADRSRSSWDPVKIEGGKETGSATVRNDNGRTLRSDILAEGFGATIRRERSYAAPASANPAASDSEPPVSDRVVVNAGAGRDVILVHSVAIDDDGTRVVRMDINGQPHEVELQPGQGLTLIGGAGNDDIVIDPDVAAAIGADIEIQGGAGYDYLSAADNVHTTGGEEGGVEVQILDADLAEPGTVETLTPQEQASIGASDALIGAAAPTADADTLFGPYPTADAAAIAMLNYVTPLSVDAGREYVGRIYRDPDSGEYFATMPAIGGPDGFSAEDVQSIPVPAGMVSAGYYHTHPDASHVSGPSSADLPTADGDYYGTAAYIATSTGLIVRYDAPA